MLPLTRSSEGLRLLSAGQIDQAIQAFQEALAQSPTDLKCLLGLARAQIATGDHAAALATFKQIFAVKPDHLEAKSHLGLMLARLGDEKGAKAVEEAAKDRRSGFIEHLNFGLYLAGKDDDRAQRELELALRSETRDPIPYLELGNIAVRRGDYRAALRHYLKANDVCLPHDPRSFLLRARVHLRLGETQAAVQAVTEALNRVPLPASGQKAVLPDGMTEHEMFQEAYQLCTEAEEFESAVQVSMRALEQDPDRPEYQGWMQQARSEAVRTAGSRARRTTTFEAMDASLVDVDALNKKAEELLFRKPPPVDEVLHTIDPVLRLKPNDPRANITKAVALSIKGLKQQALPFAQRAASGNNRLVTMEANQLIRMLTAKK